MKLQKALDHFMVTRNGLATKLGITRSAVYQWGPVIPFWSAWKLVKISDGALELGMEDYDDDGRIVHVREDLSVDV